MYRLGIIVTLLFTFPRVKATATLHEILDIIDVQNLDLANYQYFTNLPSQNPKTAHTYNPFLEHFQKKKAVIDYFEHLFLGNSPFTQESEIVFNPHFGEAWRPYYERKYGKNGEHLVALLGKGYSLDKLKEIGAISNNFDNAYHPIG